MPLSLLAMAAAVATSSAVPAVPQETASYAYQDLGQVHVFAPQGAPRGVAVVLSGDGGWKPAEASGRLVEAMAQRGVLALGVDVNPTMARMGRGSGPYDLAGQLKAMGDDAAFRYHADGPLYFGGYSAGASLAYAAAAQARPGEVAGLVTAGFCPDQETGNPVGDAQGRSMAFRAKRVAGWVYRPVDMKIPWGLIEGEKEHACPGGAVEAFAAKVPSARLFVAAGVRHSFSPPTAWRGQLDRALGYVLKAPSATR